MKRLGTALITLASCMTACGTSAGEPEYDAAAVDAYQDEVASAICRLDRECDLGLGLPDDAEGCRLEVGHLGVGLWPRGDAFRIDEGAADACRAVISSSDCGAVRADRARLFEGALLGECFEAVTGAAELGQACRAPRECASGLVCEAFRNPDDPEAPCPGRCVLRPEAPRVSVGDACMSLSCGADLVCVEGACRMRPGEGEACLGSLCAEGLRCGTDGRCAPPATAGESCEVVGCALGLRCTDDGTCDQADFGRGLDAACGEGRFCSADFMCLGAGRCFERAGDGEVCADLVAGMRTIPCEPDLYCRAAPGEPGVCTPRGFPGDACEPLAVRTGGFAPPCYGACHEGFCVAVPDVPSMCEPAARSGAARG